jgi:predicted ATP-binding protein involved in virulence
VDDNFEVLFRTPTGQVRLEALSDSFRSIFVVVADLLLRLSLSTPRKEDVLQQEAVCMIDEIDAHLHPKWQERVIPGLRALFPRVQFIATTHSPIVIASVEPHQIFRLSLEES